MKRDSSDGADRTCRIERGRRGRRAPVRLGHLRPVRHGLPVLSRAAAGPDRCPRTDRRPHLHSWIPGTPHKPTDGAKSMEVILLERIAKLGQMGEVVRVKDGFARNFLLPTGKALRATKENRSRFESMKVELEAKNLEAKGDADKIAQKLNGLSVTVLRQA